MDAGEACDDGDVTSGDGCSSTCECEDDPCRVRLGASSPLSSSVAGMPAGSTLELEPGTYSSVHHCYLIFKTGIRVKAVQGGVVFDCSSCANAAIVLAAADVLFEGVAPTT